MTTWELAACVQGWNAVHSAEQKPEPMSDARFNELKAGGPAMDPSETGYVR